MIEVITKKKDWNMALEAVEDSDFYHTFYYHDLSKKNNEIPTLIKYQDNSSYILLPLLVRDIENSEYKDATSVYGYSGLLSVIDDSSFNNENFQSELKQYFLDNKIISVFSRLHPYLKNQETILKGMGVFVNPGNVIYVDLTESLEDQRKQYSSRLKTYLNKDRKECKVIVGETEAHVKIFIELYYENMRRVNANESYFFEESYFYKLLSSPDFDTELLLCKRNDNDEILGGAIFIKKGNIVQYHLSGLGNEYLDVNPIKLIIDQMRIKAKKGGYEVFNLGGGRSNKQDSLYTFKRSFSKNSKPFLLWNYIADEKAYQNLLAKQQKVESSVNFEIDKEFFPAYRRLLIK